MRSIFSLALAIAAAALAAGGASPAEAQGTSQGTPGSGRFDLKNFEQD